MDSSRADNSIGDIAIVGMSGRFPGAGDLDEFWQNLRDGVESIARFSEQELASSGIDPAVLRQQDYVPAAAVLEDIDQFDAGFFGCTPKEAQIMDPQQRLFLECAWEALEDAGTNPETYNGQIAVYAGANFSNYMLSTLYPKRGVGGFVQDFQMLIGNAPDYLASRASYKLNLTGPSVSVQTACSTSLVAVCMGCQGLLSYQCDMVLAGGVTVRVPQKAGYVYEAGGILSPDGHCRAFDAKAQGTLLGNGVGIVALKRLGDAIADKNRIHAVIKGSAINNDGAHKIGYTAPGVDGQAKVIAMAQAVAGIDPETISYIEAHGTGTALGDPIEIEALTRVFRARTSKRGFCAIGSIKTNFGHLEAAAGIAGLIKTVLALKHGLLPPSLHFEQGNRGIDFESSPFYVNHCLSEWKRGKFPRRAGVSSFGIGGTNAHVVMEDAPARQAADARDERPLHLLTLSAKSAEALREQAARYADFLGREASESFADICFTANTGRAHFGHRIAVVAESRADARKKLERLASGESPAGLLQGNTENARSPKVAFLFTGQGSQYVGMGRQLYETEPAFRKALRECDAILRGILDASLLQVLYPEGDAAGSPLNATAYTQPVLFAFEYALARLWQSWGVQPAAVMGHSLGEYVAACVAGVLGLEDALKLVTERAAQMNRLPQDGAMIALFADEARVARAIEPYLLEVSIAAVNGPENVVISGTTAAVTRIAAELLAEGVNSQALTVSHAFHSPLMEPMLPGLERKAAELRYSLPQVSLISGVTGSLIQGAEAGNAGYWVRHARQPVRFAAGMEALRNLGCEVFLEIGPGASLLGMGRLCLPEGAALFLPSLRINRGESQQMLESLGQLYVHGAAIDWQGFERGSGGFLVTLPTYPFQRARYWADGAGAAGEPPRLRRRSSSKVAHALLGERISSPLRETQFELEVNAASPRILQEHRIYGERVFPAAAYLEMVHASAVETFCTKEDPAIPFCVLENVVIHEPLRLGDAEDSRTVQVILSPEGSASAAFHISSLGRGNDLQWKLHCAGKVSVASADATSPSAEAVNRPDIEGRCREAHSDPQALYRSMAEGGLDLGPSLQWIEAIQRRDGEALGRMRPTIDVDDDRYLVHPGLMDACFQLLAAALPEEERGAVYVPVELESLRIEGRPNGRTWGHAALRESDRTNPGAIVSDLRLFDDDGKVLISMKGLVARRVPKEAPTRNSEQIGDWLYQLQWRPLPRQDNSPLELVSPTKLAGDLRLRLESLRREHELARYRELMPEMDALSVGYAVEAFRQLGWELRVGERFGPRPAGTAMRATETSNRLLVRMLELLDRAGIIAQVEGDWMAVRRPESGDLLQRWSELLEKYPAFSAELTLLESCGRQMPEVLQGERSPLEVLFPGGSMATLESLYRDSPVSRVCNTLVQEAIATALQSVPTQRTVRVLEIGAGTGGTTAYLLPCLQGRAVDYVFTDVSPQFTAEAGKKFRDFPFVRYQLLDIGQDPTEQGFAAHQFDVVLAAHVLHATADVRRTLRHVQQLLAPNGMLVLVEGTGPQTWLDLIFGLTEGWWKFADRDLRSAHPLLSQDKWVAVLEEAGFSQAVAVPEAAETREDLSQPAVIMARRAAMPAETAAGHAAAPAKARGAWLIFADRGGVGKKLAESLAQTGEAGALVFAGNGFSHSAAGEWTIDPGQPGDFRRLVQALGEQQTDCAGVIHLWALDAPAAENLTAESLQAAQVLSCGSVLHLVQALAVEWEAQSPRLTVVTRGAQPVESEPASVAIAQAPLWGMGRVIALEHSTLQCVCIDLDPSGGDEEIDALAAEVRGRREGDQVAFRMAERRVARLVGSGAGPSASGARLQKPQEQTFRLEIGTSGVLDNLVLRPATPRPPGPREVQIRVHATGLNFRDVLNALGVYPGDAGPLGIECAGRIAAVGEGVDGFEVGDEVVAFGAACFSSHVTTNVELVARKPARLTYEEAAAVPIVFLTAAYALHRLARISPKERVLIHAATGGVGLAAVQLAERAGAVVFATAGSTEKREYLRRIGVPHVMNSRSLEFAEEVMAATGGEGVDVVLNSLAGKFIPKGLSVLRANGRFLEIGKTGIWSEDQVAQVKSDISYFVIALDQMIADTSLTVGSMFRDLMQEFQEGSLTPLPVHSFKLEEAPSAFRYMAQAKHIGKIVLVQDARPKPSQLPVAFRSDATYLITGGLGGLGLLLAAWMAGRGARHLVLMGRTGASAAAREAIDKLLQTGVEIVVAEADVSRRQDVARVLADIGATASPLRGVMHCAGVLDDGVLLRQDWARFAKVMAPKVTGAWNLHHLTSGLPLDFFVFFSSIASLLGSPGQSNHAAANAFLDALAYHRRAHGLAGLSINWGGWAEIGAAAKRPADRGASLGVATIAPQKGLAVLELAMQQDYAQIGAVPVNWQEFSRRFPGGKVPPLLSEVVRKSARPTDAPDAVGTASDISRRLQQAPPRERRALLLAHIRAQTSRVLGLDSSVAIDARRPLNELGLDSLMAIELRNALGMTAGRPLRATLLFDFPTLESLTDYLARELFPEGFFPASRPEASPPAMSQSRRQPSSMSSATARSQPCWKPNWRQSNRMRRDEQRRFSDRLSRAFEARLSLAGENGGKTCLTRARPQRTHRNCWHGLPLSRRR